MTDKEVGELWLKRHQCQNEFYARRIGELIRKLVDERKDYYALQDGGFAPTTEHLQDALRDFGIDPEEFNR